MCVLRAQREGEGVCNGAWTFRGRETGGGAANATDHCHLRNNTYVKDTDTDADTDAQTRTMKRRVLAQMAEEEEDST